MTIEGYELCAKIKVIYLVFNFNKKVKIFQQTGKNGELKVSLVKIRERKVEDVAFFDYLE